MQPTKQTKMSNSGTINPGRIWVSSQPTNFIAHSDADDDNADRSDVRVRAVNPSMSVKYDPDRPGGKIFSEKTLNSYKKKDRKNGILKTANRSEVSKPPVRFSDTDNAGRETVTTSAGGVIFSTPKSYEAVLAERDALLENDGAYRRRIQQLEEENARILLDYDGMYKENNNLRDKLEKGDDNHIESYQRVYEDRKVLREAETAYKRRINQLEQEAKEMLNNFESLYSENKVLRDKSKKLEDRLNSIDRLDDVKKINELEKKVKLLEKTVRTMGYEREELVKENNERENQMFRLREDISELNKRNMLLEKENEGFKRGFMALGKTMDSSWKNELKQKTRRQEEEERIMREEHGKFRKDIENLNKDINALEKANIELKTRNEMLEQNKQNLESRVMELAKESGKRTPSAERRRGAELQKIKDEKVQELQEVFKKLESENVQFKTKCEMLEKEKAAFEQRLSDAAKQPRETASSIRRKMETEREIKDLNTHIETFKEKMKRLEIENADLKKEQNRLEIEAKAHRKASKTLAEEREKQSDVTFKELNEKIILLNEEIKALTEENLKLKGEYNRLEDKLTLKIKTFTEERETLQNERNTLENNMMQSNTASVDKIEQLQEQLNATQVELKLLKVNHENLSAIHEEQKKENTKLAEELERTRKELDNLKESIRSNKDVYLDLSKTQRENASLRQEIDDLKNKLKTDALKQEAELEELLKNQEFMNSALAEHKIRLDMLQQEKNDLKEDNLKLVKANERQQKTIADYEVDLKNVSNEKQAKTKTLQEELDKVQKELNKSEKDLIETKQELEITKNERENEIKKLLMQMEKLKAEREFETQQLKNQSDSLRAEVARLKIFEQRIENMEANLKELVSKLKESEERNKQMTNDKLASLQQVVSEMKSENLANRIRAAEREQNELEKHKLELEIKQDTINEIRKLKEENNRLLGLLEDKRAAEDAQDEWTRKKNKFNEIIAQNKRLQEENKRVLDLFENNQQEHLKKDLEAKTDRLKLTEAKFQECSTENETLKKALREKDIEMRKIGSKADRSNRLQHENNKLRTENHHLREENSRKDHQIASLKELEITKAKYMDSAANNQRLYEENMRLRETIENSKDYKSEFHKVKNEEKVAAIQQAKYVEENTLLKNVLQVKETELRREIVLHKDRAANLQIRNKRLIDEIAKLKTDILQKDEIIIKLKSLETATGKLKDASMNVNRLYEENQRLRNLLENSNAGWRSNFRNAKMLSGDKTATTQQSAAVYVDSNKQVSTYVTFS